MMKKYSLLLSAAMLLSLSGCSGEPYTVHIQNLTGVEISEICIAPETDKSSMGNLLTETLPVDGEIELSLGKLDEEDVAKGFSILVYNGEDGSCGDFSMLYFNSGDTVSFYLDDWGLAAAVNMTEEEIEQQKQRDHEQYISATDDEET